ncbi:hypothetical protein AGLY_013383 [Aphis glycines]|uniref:Uncharacterized protein n=1 Tax=Aphis glycines TaxID=307491 RepID=A0A6G0T8B0_APHGL|nr:hypothetical protein AGLY_013383 [Aphis glycines]
MLLWISKDFCGGIFTIFLEYLELMVVSEHLMLIVDLYCFLLLQVLPGKGSCLEVVGGEIYLSIFAQCKLSSMSSKSSSAPLFILMSESLEFTRLVFSIELFSRIFLIASGISFSGMPGIYSHSRPLLSSSSSSILNSSSEISLCLSLILGVDITLNCLVLGSSITHESTDLELEFLGPSLLFTIILVFVNDSCGSLYSVYLKFGQCSDLLIENTCLKDYETFKIRTMFVKIKNTICNP